MVTNASAGARLGAGRCHPDGEWRSALVERFASVRAFVPVLCDAIEFGATAQATGILEAMTYRPRS